MSHYQDDHATVHHGDCLDVLRELPDNSVDSVVTDPPYNLSFMSREWDTHASAEAFQKWCEQWAVECLRVLKPGGHMLAFGGTRTWHRLACAIEDAGFDVRDSIAWLYGSGFPKSLDVSKAIDKMRDDRPEILAVTTQIKALRDEAGLTNRDLDDLFEFSGMAGHWTSTKSQPAVPTVEQWTKLRDVLNPPAELDAEVWRLNGRKGTPGEAWATADVLRIDHRHNEPSGIVGVGQGQRVPVAREVKAANSDAAAQWVGFGTSLKPAFEPVVVARKPLQGTVAANVLRWGTGALNIDGCRVSLNGESWGGNRDNAHTDYSGKVYGAFAEQYAKPSNPVGRWPANVLLDGEMADALDQQSGPLHTQNPATRNRRQNTGWSPAGTERRVVDKAECNVGGHGEAGTGASRFFPVFRYQAKAPTSERPSYVKEGAGDPSPLSPKNVRQCNVCGSKAKADSSRPWPTCGHEDWQWVPQVRGGAGKVAHPTVKPLSLLRWLVRLVTPPGGTVLEPFAGSGTTVEAAILEGFAVVAIEREADYLPLIRARIDRAHAQLATVDNDQPPTLFDEEAS